MPQYILIDTLDYTNPTVVHEDDEVVIFDCLKEAAIFAREKLQKGFFVIANLAFFSTVCTCKDCVSLDHRRIVDSDKWWEE